MSAFIVDDKTINRIVTYTAHVLPRKWNYLANKFQEINLNITNEQELGEKLLQLNVEAVNCRYQEDTQASEFNYSFRPEPVGEIQVYKSLQCFLYQCTEGDIMHKPLYRLMQDVKHYVASEIVTNLPEYQVAQWE